MRNIVDQPRRIGPGGTCWAKSACPVETANNNSMDRILFMASVNLMIRFPSPSIDDVVRQLINIRILIVGSDYAGLPDLTDDLGNASA